MRKTATLPFFLLLAATGVFGAPNIINVNPGNSLSKAATPRDVAPNPSGLNVQVFEFIFSGLDTGSTAWLAVSFDRWPAAYDGCKILAFTRYNTQNTAVMTLHDDDGAPTAGGPAGWIGWGNDALYPATIHQNRRCRLYKQGSAITVGPQTTIRVAVEFLA